MSAIVALMSLFNLNLAAAGQEFSWTAPNGATIGSRPRSDAMPGLTQWLINMQRGICAACGEALDGTERIEVCHIIRGRERGYVSGNLYAGHTSCNNIDATVYGAIVPIASLVRADIVPTSAIPSHSQLKALSNNSDKRARRLSLRNSAMSR